jgi:putative transposase
MARSLVTSCDKHKSFGFRKTGEREGAVIPLDSSGGYTDPLALLQNGGFSATMKVVNKRNWKSTETAVYSIRYHFVWSTWYRRHVLLPPVDASLKEALLALAAERGYEVLALEVMPNHVHVFLSAPPKESPSTIAKVLKGATARKLFTRHPELRKRLKFPPRPSGATSKPRRRKRRRCFS